MSDPENTSPPSEAEVEDPALHSAEGVADPFAEEAPPEPVDPLTEAQQEADKWKDLAYRSQAELDNFRKRSAREAQDTRAYANGELLRSVLPILDNFEMGMQAAKAESEKSMVFIGMQMVHRQFQDFLKDSGMQEVEAEGKTFDPNVHDAVSKEASDDVAEGTVLRVTRRGFRLKDRLLRPASVIVSSGPADSTPAS